MLNLVGSEKQVFPLLASCSPFSDRTEFLRPEAGEETPEHGAT